MKIIYEILGILAYWLLLYLCGIGEETFESTSNTAKRYCLQIPIITFLIYILCYTEWYLPN